MKLFSASIAAFFLAFSGLASPAMAQESPIVLTSGVELVTFETHADGDRREVRAEPATIVPGDRLVFTLSYTNRSDAVIEDFVVTNPLPAAVRLAPDAPADLDVSVDGGKTWGTLADLSVAVEDGTSRAAQHADVTHIRWVLARVEPGDGGQLEYHAIIR